MLNQSNQRTPSVSMNVRKPILGESSETMIVFRWSKWSVFRCGFADLSLKWSRFIFHTWSAHVSSYCAARYLAQQIIVIWTKTLESNIKSVCLTPTLHIGCLKHDIKSSNLNSQNCVLRHKSMSCVSRHLSFDRS